MPRFSFIANLPDRHRCLRAHLDTAPTMQGGRATLLARDRRVSAASSRPDGAGRPQDCHFLLRSGGSVKMRPVAHTGSTYLPARTGSRIVLRLCGEVG